MSDDRRQEAYRLYVQEGMPVRAIAQALGVPINTVYTWIHRERKARESPERATEPERARPVKGSGAKGNGPSVKGPVDEKAPEPETKAPQVALAPPPPDRWGRPSGSRALVPLPRVDNLSARAVFSVLNCFKFVT
jgi:transposase-like protein